MTQPAPRSLLYCSALHPEQYAKSALTDVMVIDLEDGVPHGQKVGARACVEQFYRSQVSQRTALRINPLRDNEGLLDLLLVQSLEQRPEFIIMAMTEAAAEIDVVRANLMRDGESPKILVTVETPACLKDIYAMASGADGLIFGSADYAASLGVQIGGWANILHARVSIIAAASVAGIPAFDTAYFNLEDDVGLMKECQDTRELGFSGKTSIHPRQIPIINEAFTPSQAEYEHALAVVQAADNSGEKITRLKNLMVGPPFVKQARKLIQRARDLGL
ncbi:CoA ester lyase [Pseudomonas sp. SORT22]|uniref:HpcH/HpaI aldolase/citrate lyase family protein n=1 Tax=Pseudomonas sp. SORT22 TaxID=2813842 RepID=UPI001BCFC6F4|nr:CoA ester lyase [Pseudomonas sp. SORT22]QVM94952.1 CoA ester lyase [Pseudomonas sp. SORT22]